ncbi:hypothetical protein O7606_16870 [Micromonospora sp. WMMD882]|uniref:VHL beta domain-containing protein n=1 Tax=Micromonospora sp. WMMD882 TaxID=3015151 RepID=UPI00248C6502|nr:hypothetical protein [Micromonospora sp. WMMD882]WBB77928.1 hypothetical protein O7606_16870 [Micromonospora sp. WMMD882]
MLLVALVVGVLTTTLGWAFASAVDERAPHAVTEPPLPAVPLPTLDRGTPSVSVRTGRPSPSATTRSPSPTASPSPTGKATRSASPAAPSPSATSRPPSGPSPDGVPGLPELTALPASRERDLEAENGGPATSVEFVNRRDEQVTVYWLNHWGHRVRLERLDPGESHRQSTYVGHPWVVTDRHGTALAVFQPIAEPARATVR